MDRVRVALEACELYELFSSTPPARILVHNGGVGNFTLLDAFLYPLKRLDVFLRLILIGLHKALKHFGVWVRKYDSC